MNRIELIKNISKNHSDKLYKDFVEQFYSYIPIDYLNIFNEEKLKIFCEHSFEFIKTKTKNRTAVFKQVNSPTNMAIFSILGDDMPFIVDSIKTLLHEHKILYECFLHPLISVKRDNNGQLLSFDKDGTHESLVCISVKGKIADSLSKEIIAAILDTLVKVETTYNAWSKILESTDESIKNINNLEGIFSQEEINESKDFLEWIKKENFTFLGCIDFDISKKEISNVKGDSSIWDDGNEIKHLVYQENHDISKIIEFGKLDKISKIHRSNFIDFIIVKNFDHNKKFIGGRVFIGLYGSNIDYQSVSKIPIIREKLSYILQKTHFPAHGYNYKKLRIIVESMPRTALFHIDKDELLDLCIHTLSAMSVGNLKLFRLGECKQNFVELIIFMPRSRFTPDAHLKIQNYIQNKFNADVTRNFITEVSQHYAFLYVTFASDNCSILSDLQRETLEKDLELLTSFWEESFVAACDKIYGSEEAFIYSTKYSSLFPNDYKFKHTPEEAAKDLAYLEKLSKESPTLCTLDNDGNLYLKIFSFLGKFTLSDTMPLLENLGFLVLEEQTYSLENSANICIHRYSLTLKHNFKDYKKLKSLVEDSFYAILSNKTSADELSKLITCSEITWREVDLIRTIAFYIHQTKFSYDYTYVSETLIKHFEYTKNLIKFFDLKFNINTHNIDEAAKLAASMNEYLVTVTSSAEDTVLRTMLLVIEASVRTNYYQKKDGHFKDYISIKFNSAKVPNLPLPLPYAEIFVFSNDFEAIHLRGGKVARGGIRWSDRGEDYRVEVLGLMKAQMTKNTVIVPVGSKGGFYTKFKSQNMTKEQYMARSINCYQNFLRGLLDLTDNIVGAQIIKPHDVVVYDEDDPYLVVAADKGTASFSDYANSVSLEYGYWLGDAFASGGSAGYDHKKMAITAKGAWISVQRHFKELGIDVQTDNITVAGIGDMAGDVFGNGLLLSESVKLVAAFNHMHIFIDPNPDPKKSFEERKRLFNLPGSKWSDYSPSLISQGGAVFDRKAKKIELSKEIKDLLDITEDEIIPDQLIKAILKANVDLLWNGGIGTYIKASFEENYAIGDKTNDNLRINGSDVRATVIGEGGNLGMSQYGRIEYAKSGGRLNTDFVDNSAGVDCSDHEVNIKIAFGKSIQNKKLTTDSRNSLLTKMTSEVAELVLEDNKYQTLALTIMQHSPIYTMETFIKLIDILEEENLLQRNVEFIPSNTELVQRANNKETLTRPELSVILSYSKRSVYDELQQSKISTDPYFEKWLIEYFPPLMRKEYTDEILTHPLRSEIILTTITNKLVNQLSGPVISSLKRETGAFLCDIARGFVIVQEIFDLHSLWNAADKLPSTTPLNVLIEIYTDINKVHRRGISWMISNLKHPLNIGESIDLYKESVLKISEMMLKNLYGSAKDKFDSKFTKYIEAGIPEEFAEKCAKLESLISSFDIAFISKDTGAYAESICESYFKVGTEYNIDWLRKSCDKLMTESYWQRLSLQSLKDDLYDKQRRIIKVIAKSKMLDSLEEWFVKKEHHSQIFNNFVENLKQLETIDISMIILANKKLEMFLRKI